MAGLNSACVVDRKACGELARFIQESPRVEAFDEEKLKTLSNFARAK